VGPKLVEQMLNLMYQKQAKIPIYNSILLGNTKKYQVELKKSNYQQAFYQKMVFPKEIYKIKCLLFAFLWDQNLESKYIISRCNSSSRYITNKCGYSEVGQLILLRYLGVFRITEKRVSQKIFGWFIECFSKSS